MKEEFYISLIGEAFDGYTAARIGKQGVYVKHINIRDQRYLHQYYEKYRGIALDRGLESEEDRISYVLKEDLWSPEEDLQLATLKGQLENLQRTVKLLPLPSQRENMQGEIKDIQKQLNELAVKRKQVIGQTAEDYATVSSGDEILRFLLFKDPDLKEHLYTEKQFGELEAWEISQITAIQADVHERLSDIRIQEAVLRPCFSMYLALCEDVAGFYGKPIPSLTIHQLKVALFGRMFFNIFQFTEDIPDGIRQDPEKLIAFSDAKRNGGSRPAGLKDDADVSMVFGATNEDMKTLNAPKGNKAFSEEAKKHGGQLNMEQMMRLAGQDV